MQNPRGIVLVIMIVLAAATRLVPPLVAPWVNLWNFTAIGAMCLFGAAYFQRKSIAFAVPMAALLLSDVILTTMLYGFKEINVISFSYVLFGLTTLLGMALRGRVTFLNVTAVAVIASAGFFLLSNFHVWLSGHGESMKDVTLLSTYIAGLPFAKNMLLGNLFFSGVLFGGYELLSRRYPVLQRSSVVSAS
jgi:hypothetical protein